MLKHLNFHDEVIHELCGAILGIKHCKMSLPRIHLQAFDQFHDVTEGPVRMADNEDSG